MASVEMPSALKDMLDKLDPSRIPDKLTCPADDCGKFLLNAFKVSCCDQFVCEPCFEKPTDQCPVCQHKPFSKDLGTPSKSVRTTAKVFLKTEEKKMAQQAAPKPSVAETTKTVSQDRTFLDTAAPNPHMEDTRTAKLSAEHSAASEQAVPSIEAVDESLDAREQETASPELVVEPLPEHFESASGEERPLAQTTIEPLENSQHDLHSEPEVKGESTSAAINNPTTNMNMNIDPTQMMQFMQANGMGAMNPMLMGFPNMMNAMSQGMFGGFGGMGLSGMNGLNMNMNYNSNSGVYGTNWNGPNNNTWNQNNNPNSFANGFGDFGSNFGNNYNTSGNFQQGDFGFPTRGYGRGRNRGRGGWRGRGNYQHVQQNHSGFRNAHEQQQYEIQNMQAQMTMNPAKQDDSTAGNTSKDADIADQGDDDFAPGGQDEVQEALGEDYRVSQTNETAEPETAVIDVSAKAEVQAMGDVSMVDDTVMHPATHEGLEYKDAAADTVDPLTPRVEAAVPPESPVANGPVEETKQCMPPPSAPLGPSAHFREPEDYGFRARGSGRFSRARGSFSGQNGSPISPRQPPLPTSVQSPESKGVGVVGAPTGPRAMREPREPREPSARPPRQLSTSSAQNGGFQIVGRASKARQDHPSEAQNGSRTPTSTNGYPRQRSRSRSASRQPSHHARQDGRYVDEAQEEYARDHDRDYERDRKRRKSRKYDHDDHEMQDAEDYRSRSLEPEDRKSSHRSRRDKERHTSSKHTSRSHRHHHKEANGDGMDDYGQPVPEDDSRSSYVRSSKSRRYDDKDPDRDRDRERGDGHRDRDRDRDRKRSRHDRDDAVAEDEAEAEYESRHRSRRHKKDHRHSDREPGANGITPTSRSHESSRAASPLPPHHQSRSQSQAHQPEKDPHTLEREARNRERMQKEQQRREKAANLDHHAPPSSSAKRRGTGATGTSTMMMTTTGARRVSYKYEDDLKSSLVENERESSRWR